MPLWEASKQTCAHLSGAESVEKLQVRYELGSAFVPAAIAAAFTNPMVSLLLLRELSFFRYRNSQAIDVLAFAGCD